MNIPECIYPLYCILLLNYFQNWVIIRETAFGPDVDHKILNFEPDAVIGLDFLESLDKGACGSLNYWPWFLISCSIHSLVMPHQSVSLFRLCAWPRDIPIWPLLSPLSPWEELPPGGFFPFHLDPRMNTRAAEPFQTTNRPSWRKQSCPAELILDQESCLSQSADAYKFPKDREKYRNVMTV